MSYIGKINAGGSDYKVGSTLYGTCDTAAATAAKVAVVEGFDTLETGVTVHIKFTYSNSTSTQPTLAIKPSSSGTATTAKNIYKAGTTKPGTTAATSWVANSVVSFTYDGTAWMMNDHIDDTTNSNTWRAVQVNGTQKLSTATSSGALNIKDGTNTTVSYDGGVIINATDTTYESKTAASGGTDVSLCTTGEKYTWNNAETTVHQKLDGSTTTSKPLLMSSTNYTNTTTDYTGDVLRNNNIYANPSTGSITALGWVNSGDGTSDTARLVRAANGNGYAGVMAGSSGTGTHPHLGVMTKGDADSDETNGDYIIWRSCKGAASTNTTSGTYIGGYNYINEWENFLVQGRSGHFWGTIPAVTSNNGILEIGKHIDFHLTSGTSVDNDYRISCTANGAATYSGTWTKSSSEKIKENIEDLDLEEAEKILDLRPVSFDYKEGFGADDQVGLIAEEVEKVIPRLVVPEFGTEGTDDWTPASVDYIGIVPYLLKVVQEQQKEIEELKAKVG